jgi:hypothetical protein
VTTLTDRALPLSDASEEAFAEGPSTKSAAYGAPNLSPPFPKSHNITSPFEQLVKTLLL